MSSPKDLNPSPGRLGPPFIVKRGRHSGTQEVERCVQWLSLSPVIAGQNTLNVLLRWPLALLGALTKPVPSVAALPCSHTRPGQRGMQRHVGWQAAELVWWQGLHEDLYATM